MKIFSAKRSLLAAGIITLTVGVGVFNYMQANNGNAPSLITVKDAHADVTCLGFPAATCSWVDQDGLSHTLTNAERG